MLAVGLDRAGTEDILRGLGARTLEIACENAPASTVMCGSEADVALAVARLEQQGIQHRLLRGNVAFHSRAMDPIEADLRESLAFLDALPLKAEVPFVSSVTGEVTSDLDAAYWWSNVRCPVRFMAAVRTAARDFRPSVVIEVSPHVALTPVVRQCLADTAEAPACVPTLVREKDSRLSFHQALGTLYREGVSLDFAAQYPRVRPVSHLLPPHPKDEHRVMDPMADDIHFPRRGEYSAGPLVGRRIPGRQPRFEVRMSAADFPWLAEHRVQHTPIMPGAGYIELVLQALGNVPVHFERVEFLKPCLLAEPVRLQTELAPEPGSDDDFTFRISSVSFDDDAPASVLHCTGKVRRLPADLPGGPDLPGAPDLDELDRSRFAVRQLDSREAFYGRVDAVVGEYFHYGPRFQVVQSVRQEAPTKELLLELRLDDALWHDGRRAGFLMPPPLLDGGLQSSLYYLMECSDMSALPRRMEGLTIDRLPTSARLVCHLVPGDMSTLHDRGQLALTPGERDSGSMTLYDAATGARVAHLARYFCVLANPKQDAPGRSRYQVRWQPKFVPDAARLASLSGGTHPPRPPLGGTTPLAPPAVLAGSLPDDRLDLSGLIDAMERRPGDAPYACRVAEFGQALAPEQIVAADYLRRERRGGAAELWLLGASAPDTQRLFEAFGHRGAAVRFATADLSDPASIDLGRGLLRRSACDLVVVSAPATTLTADTWTLLRRLLLPGGLVLVRHPDPGFTRPGPGWSRLADGRAGALWAAPPVLSDDGPASCPGPRWVIAGRHSLGELWAGRWAPGARRVDPQSLDSGWPWSSRAQAEMRALGAIDFFCDEPDDDPLGEQLVARFLAFMRALTAAREQEPGAPCRLTVISRGAAFDVHAPRAATLWGAVRALGHELSPGLGLDMRLVDVAGPSDLPVLGWLARHDVRESELAIREGRLHAPRLVSRPGAYATVPASQADRYRLCVTAPGQITGLAMRSEPAEPLGPRDVEIDVAAAALNFRDLMVTLDLLPLASYERSALGRQVGIEASGTIRRIGSEVTSRHVGEPVVFMKGGCIANRVTVGEDLVFPAPAALSMAESAAAVSVYVTAYYALVDLARLRAGQRVLIHSAMGGVGQAAIALARHVGATVYATAGTPEKRAKLLELGVAAAFDSHSYRWYDDLLEATGGEGVDVVLNSLAGRHIALCLEALRPGGWHCEIGKVDIYADAALGLSVFRKNLRFAAIDVDRLMHDDPAYGRELTQACLRLLGDGTMPALPVTSYGYADYESALRFMASGQHEGKLVLVAPSEGSDLPVIDRRPFLDPEATYLVTGGLGGFGLRLLAYLVSAGARHLTLMDRDPDRRRGVDWVRRASDIAYFFADRGVEIDIVQADVSSRADVDRCVAGLTRPLKGVFHLAAVLDDGLLADIGPESVADVFAPKAGGAWHLHEATMQAPLDYFVMLSSVASVFGNAGQSVYAAANAFLDGLASYRRRLGLPALAYNMAAVAEAGMAARNPRLLRLMRASGMPAVSAALAIANLDFALRAMPAAAHLVGVDIGRLPGGAEHPDYMRIGRWMVNDANPSGLGDAGAEGVTVDAIVRELCREIAKLSGDENVGPTDTIASFGVNSLSVAELMAFIKARFNYPVSALDLMTTATPESIATLIVRGKTRPAEAAVAAGDAVAAATGRKGLPEQCQEDLEFLQNTIRALTEGGPGREPTPADRFGAVFLTGATGFVGRFVLGELLRHSDQVVVHCLVRAEDEARGLERIRHALRAAGIWEDAFESRIRAWPGDIRDARFGLPEPDFDGLCEQIDAVYHLAAELNLVSSYAAMREANTRSFKHVLELALRRRTKHIFYASTMGVFPQYFCNFAGDFSDHAIDDEAQPDLDLMTSVLPPGLLGYPWSKLVVERSLLFGQSLGLPVAIMRLPQMGLSASTGYTQSGDIKIRIAMAVLDVGVMPAGFRLQWTEPVDSVSEILTTISLNPNRQRTIYHLCHPTPDDHGLELADFGFDVREVSYAEFKRACLARGSRGPLHGYWPLVDHFADYWFPAGPWSQARPVAVGAIAADAPNPPHWPGLITSMARSFAWVQRQEAAWPYERPDVSLDTTALRRQAHRFADRMNVRFDDAYPPSLLEGLDRLVGALREPAARIREDRIPVINFDLSRKLWNRASLAGEYAAQPAIAREPVDRPVFILGINRTGTTFLHRLMAQGRRFWAVYPHELAHPALPPGRPETARRCYADDILAATRLVEAMSGIHPVDPDEPEEEFAILEESFAAWTYTMRYFVPEYLRWLDKRDGREAYAVHRRTLQHLSWQRGTRLGEGSRQWLLKMPFHLAELEALAATYPDAVFIQTHREPREFMPSWLSLVESFRSLAAGAPDKPTLGAEQLDFMSRMLEGAAEFRSAHPEIDRRFIDVSYRDLVDDPIRVVEEIYRQFGWTFDEETRVLTGTWQTEQAARRQAEPRHRYSLEEYGLTPQRVEGAFSRYAEFVQANKVRLR
ncbi:MAG TPA: SDR family NAD(P)-dependent oxidoreductase [Streptosporangiaceae bacterium]